VNSYFPKYCSMRKGLMCMGKESGKGGVPQSSAKLTIFPEREPSGVLADW